MINILIEGMTYNTGGKETYIMNMYRAFDKEKFKFSFVAYDEKIAYESEILSLGARVFRLPPRSRGLVKHRKAISELLSENRFDVVWSHKTTLSACELLEIATHKNVPVRIIHSHSSSNMGGLFTLIMHSINRLLILKWSNYQYACSKPAAEWFYGSREVRIVKNGIPLEKYKYDKRKREELRKKFELNNNIVIGHIGRFGIEKNHKKIISIFNEVVKQNPQTRLVLCGDGEERKNIEKQIKTYGLDDKVLMLGLISNAHEWMQAFDVLIMPSLFEGLPFALIEAQAAGLKCIVSDKVSRESDITGWNIFLPLELEDEKWANKLLEVDFEYDRSLSLDILKREKFDLSDNVREIEDTLMESIET